MAEKRFALRADQIRPPYLGAPVRSAFERDRETGRFVEVEEPAGE